MYELRIKKAKMTKKRINLSIEDEIYREFQDYCEKHGMVASKKVELYMKEELKKAKK